MMLLFYILIFILSALGFFVAGEWTVKGLAQVAKFFGLREFVVAFFVMAFAGSLPNFFVGITAALKNISHFSFGDVAGNNIAVLTLAVAMAVLIGKRELPAKSRTVQTTSLFTLSASLLPLLLILDSELSRIDGTLLLCLFAFYIFWLFSKKERFTRVYDNYKAPLTKEVKFFFLDIFKVILGILLFILAAQGIVVSASYFAKALNLPIVVIGLLLTGLTSILPEAYFAILSAKKGEVWMILGDLMGAVIVPSTLVLGIVSLISPMKFESIGPLAIARLFLVFGALFFFFSVKTGYKVTKKEAIFLLFLYFFFVISQILFQLK